MVNSRHNLWAIACVVGGWYILFLLVDTAIVPPPVKTLLNTVELIMNEELIKHLGYSLYRLGVALSLSLLTGVAMGILLGKYKFLDKVITPSIYMLYPTPKAAFLPLFFVFFGLGDLGKIMLIYTILVFQVILTVRSSLKNMNEEYFIAAKTLGLKDKDLIRHVILPGIMPDVFTALRLNIGIGISVLFFCENYATEYGLGYFIMNKWSLILYMDMYSGILTLSLLGWLLFNFMDILEKKVCLWSDRS